LARCLLAGRGDLRLVVMEIVVILALVLLNGLFAMAEISIVSARRQRLQQWVAEGRAGAEAALALADDPRHFLSAIQVGITTIGILSGAFGEASIAQHLERWLETVGPLAPHKDVIALVVTVTIITYLSVVLGELVPKRIALYRAEPLAVVIARPIGLMARLFHPFVVLLSASSELVLRLLGMHRRSAEPPVTEEEIKVLMEQGKEAGVFQAAESELVSNVLRLDELRIGALLTPRPEIDYLDIQKSFDENRHTIIESPHSMLPVCRGGLGNVLGVLRTGDLLSRSLQGQAIDLLGVVKPPLYVPETLTAIRLLETFKRHRAHLALVVDEYGELQGLVTLNDVMTAIVGDIPSIEEEGDLEIVQREDGSWLIDAMLSVEDLRSALDIEALPGEDAGNYHTVGGFVMMQLGRIPAVADHFHCGGWRFEVVDMDRNRVDRVLASRVPEEPPPTGGADQERAEE
jgi:putative hemolysin